MPPELGRLLARGIVVGRREVADSAPCRSGLNRRQTLPGLPSTPVGAMPQPGDRHPDFIAEPGECWAMVHSKQLQGRGGGSSWRWRLRTPSPRSTSAPRRTCDGAGRRGSADPRTRCSRDGATPSRWCGGTPAALIGTRPHLHHWSWVHIASTSSASSLELALDRLRRSMPPS